MQLTVRQGRRVFAEGSRLPEAQTHLTQYAGQLRHSQWYLSENKPCVKNEK